MGRRRSARHCIVQRAPRRQRGYSRAGVVRRHAALCCVREVLDGRGCHTILGLWSYRIALLSVRLTAGRCGDRIDAVHLK